MKKPKAGGFILVKFDLGGSELLLIEEVKYPYKNKYICYVRRNGVRFPILLPAGPNWEYIPNTAYDLLEV